MAWSCRIIHGVEAFRRLDMMMADAGFLWGGMLPSLGVYTCPVLMPHRPRSPGCRITATTESGGRRSLGMRLLAEERGGQWTMMVW